MWGSCFFAWIPLLLFRFPPLPPLPPPKSHLPHQITPHSSQLHFSSQLITAPLLISSSQLNSSQHPITAPLLTIHSSQLNSSQLLPLLTIKTHHSSTSHHQLITAQLLTIHSSQLNSSQLHFSHLTSHTSLITSSPLTSLITSPLITAPLLRGQQTAFLVAGAAPHNSFKAPHTSSTHMFESCGCLSGGRRSTQSVLEELRRAWPAVGPRLLFAWQAQYTERPGGAAARVAAAGAAAAFRVAGAVHRGPGCLSRGRRSTESVLEELWRAWPPLGPRLPFAWQAQYIIEPPGQLAARPRWAAFAWQAQYTELAWQAQYTEPPGGAAAFVWQAQCTEPPGRPAARVAAAGPLLAGVWQAHHTEPPGGVLGSLSLRHCVRLMEL